MFKKFTQWLRSLFAPPTHTAIAHYETVDVPMPYEPEPIKPTKAYADQRQKSRRRRRRKPGKAMANLYHL